MVTLRLKSKLWLVDENDRIIFGEGRKEILENVERTGSLNQTAKTMKLSYKGVWSKIRATEKYLNEKIVHTDRREGSRLTERGKELLKHYTILQERCFQAEHTIFESMFGDNRQKSGAVKK